VAKAVPLQFIDLGGHNGRYEPNTLDFWPIIALFVVALYWSRNGQEMVKKFAKIIAKIIAKMLLAPTVTPS